MEEHRFHLFSLEICQIWEQSLNRPVWLLLELIQLLVFLEFLLLLVLPERLLLLVLLERLQLLQHRRFCFAVVGFFLTPAPSAFDPVVAACYELALVLRCFHQGE